MTSKLLTADALQGLLRYMAGAAAAHYAVHRNLPPDLVLAWMDGSAVSRLHQFPPAQVRELMATVDGRKSLGQAIERLLSDDEPVPAAASRRPDAIVQLTLVPRTDEGSCCEALAVLVFTGDANYCVAIPADPRSGTMRVPKDFDLSAARL